MISATVIAAALPAVSKSIGNLLTMAIVVIVVCFAAYVFLCCLKKGLDILDEEERLRREHRENKERAEASNKKSHHAKGVPSEN